MPIIQPIHKGAPTAAIAQKKISIPGTRSPEGRVPVGTRMSLGRRNKQRRPELADIQPLLERVEVYASNPS